MAQASETHEPAARVRDWRRVAETVGLFLTVAALILAAKQFVDSTAQHAKLEQIASTLSTQPVGTFPDNLDAIIQAVRNTRRELHIMADVVAYGHFSAPAKFDAYKDAVKQLRHRKCEVTILAYADQAHDDVIKAQFRSERFGDLKRQPVFVEFFKVHDKIPVPGTYEDFLAVLQRRQAQFAAELNDAGVLIKRLDNVADIPFFLWLCDGEEAIFSFYNLGENVREVSFRTLDGNLVTAMNEVYRETERKAQ
jgi:hypothetical protein